MVLKRKMEKGNIWKGEKGKKECKDKGLESMFKGEYENLKRVKRREVHGGRGKRKG